MRDDQHEQEPPPEVEDIFNAAKAMVGSLQDSQHVAPAFGGMTLGDLTKLVNEIASVAIDRLLNDQQWREPELVPCEMCDNGQWWTECCNGAGGCTCQGQPVCMGTCRVCGGTGMRRVDADKMANVNVIRSGSYCFVGSGPRDGSWPNAPRMHMK